MKDIRNDIRTIRTYCVSIAFSAFLFLAFGSVAFAQHNTPVQVAEAMNLKAKTAEVITQYRGMPELMAPLASLNYPEDAKKMGIEGRVVLRYTINKQGKATDVEVLYGLGYGCDEEAARIIKAAIFRPLVNSQGEVESRTFTTPLTFRLN